MTNEEKVKEMKRQMEGIKEKVKFESNWLEHCCGYNHDLDIAEQSILDYVSKVKKYLEGILNE